MRDRPERPLVVDLVDRYRRWLAIAGAGHERGRAGPALEALDIVERGGQRLDVEAARLLDRLGEHVQRVVGVGAPCARRLVELVLVLGDEGFRAREIAGRGHADHVAVARRVAGILHVAGVVGAVVEGRWDSTREIALAIRAPSGK